MKANFPLESYLYLFDFCGEDKRVLQTAFLFSALLLDIFETYLLVNLLSPLDIFVLENCS